MEPFPFFRSAYRKRLRADCIMMPVGDWQQDRAISRAGTKPARPSYYDTTKHK